MGGLARRQAGGRCPGAVRRAARMLRARCLHGPSRSKRTAVLAGLLLGGLLLYRLYGSTAVGGGTADGTEQRPKSTSVLGVPPASGAGQKAGSTNDPPPVHGAVHRATRGNFEPPPEPSRHGIGERGRSVALEEWETPAVEKSVREYSLNLYASDKISLDRSLTDLRDPQCKHWHYPERLPEVSVIIPFHNEGWSTLMRTVHSIINRSPPYLLKEVLLVDDFSTKEHLGRQLMDYVRTPKLRGLVKLLRTRRREGVIGARAYGFGRALAPVVVSLDCHCEVGTNWLPPLLSVLASNRTSIAVPIIDVIDSMDYRLYPQGDGRLARGMFDWSMDYKQMPGLPDRERRGRRFETQPYRSPVFSGTAFAMYRSFFFRLGGYDSGLKMYGGENYELSFKTWMCGSGSVLWVPCSRIGHVYKVNSLPPYTFPGDTLSNYRDKNYARLAEVWLDDFKDYLYASRPHLRAPSFSPGDVSRRVALRREKGCRSFGWLLEEVAFDLTTHFPPPPKLVVTGQIRGLDTDFCLDTNNQVPSGEGVGLTMHKCYGPSGGNQFFRLTTAGDIRVNDFCLGQREQSVVIAACNSRGVIRDWQHVKAESTIRSRGQTMCLERAGLSVQLSPCLAGHDPQLWTFDDPSPGPLPDTLPAG